MKRIPRAFQMGAFRVVVKVLPEADMDALGKREGLGDIDGLCDFAHHTIYVRQRSKSLPKARQMQVFWHEYFHMLLYCTGRERLARDEVLVDTCGSLQLQAFNSAEF